MVSPKTLVFCLCAVLLISILFHYIPDADALTKGSGVKNPKTNSDKVCGDKLCDSPMSIDEKIRYYIFKNIVGGKKSLIPQSTFQVGGVAQQGSFIETIDVSMMSPAIDLSYYSGFPVPVTGKITPTDVMIKEANVSIDGVPTLLGDGELAPNLPYHGEVIFDFQIGKNEPLSVGSHKICVGAEGEGLDSASEIFDFECVPILIQDAPKCKCLEKQIRPTGGPTTATLVREAGGAGGANVIKVLTLEIPWKLAMACEFSTGKTCEGQYGFTVKMLDNKGKGIDPTEKPTLSPRGTPDCHGVCDKKWGHEDIKMTYKAKVLGNVETVQVIAETVCDGKKFTHTMTLDFNGGKFNPDGSNYDSDKQKNKDKKEGDDKTPLGEPLPEKGTFYSPPVK